MDDFVLKDQPIEMVQNKSAKEQKEKSSQRIYELQTEKDELNITLKEAD